MPLHFKSKIDNEKNFTDLSIWDKSLFTRYERGESFNLDANTKVTKS